MASYDLHNQIKTSVALDYQTIASDTTTAGNIIDTQFYESVEFILVSATITDGDYAPLIEEGDASNLSDAATVTADYLLGTTAQGSFTEDDDDNETRRIGYVGKKRYVRLSIVSTNFSASGGSLTAIAVLNAPRHAATSADT